MNTPQCHVAAPKAVIFDLDGTLLDTLADIAASVDQMLAAYGYPQHSLDAYRGFIGNGWTTLVRRALPHAHRSAEQIARCVQASQEIYRRNWKVRTRHYDGMAELVARLRRMGIPMAVLSNKPHRFTLRYVEAYFQPGDFKAVMGQNEQFPIKPDPASALSIARLIGLPPEAFLFVGDSVVDLQTAAAAGMQAVGVAWGFGGRSPLEAYGCPTIVAHPAEILSLFSLDKA